MFRPVLLLRSYRVFIYSYLNFPGRGVIPERSASRWERCGKMGGRAGRYSLFRMFGFF